MSTVDTKCTVMVYRAVAVELPSTLPSDCLATTCIRQPGGNWFPRGRMAGLLRSSVGSSCYKRWLSTVHPYVRLSVSRCPVRNMNGIEALSVSPVSSSGSSNTTSQQQWQSERRAPLSPSHPPGPDWDSAHPFRGAASVLSPHTAKSHCAPTPLSGSP